MSQVVQIRAHAAIDRVDGDSAPLAHAEIDRVDLDSAPPAGSDRFRHPSEWLSDPCVRVWFAPGAAATEMAEHFGGERGPDPTWVVRRTLDRLALRPHKVIADPHESRARAAWLSLEFDGRRLARIDGLDDDQVNMALIALHMNGVGPRDLLPAVTPDTLASAEAELVRRAADRAGYLSRRQAPIAAAAAEALETARSASRPQRRVRPPAPAQDSFL